MRAPAFVEREGVARLRTLEDGATLTAALASNVAALDGSTVGTPAASVVVEGSNAGEGEQWESDSSSRWGDSDDSDGDL